MRSLLSLVCLMAFIFSACNKHHDPFPDGSYEGTFQRIELTGQGPKSGVKLFFQSGSFSCQADSARYPATCPGSFTINGSSVHFENPCFWTADFDWTLILEGDFTYDYNGGHLRFWRTFQNHTDIYDVSKKN